MRIAVSHLIAVCRMACLPAHRSLGLDSLVFVRVVVQRDGSPDENIAYTVSPGVTNESESNGKTVDWI